MIKKISLIIPEHWHMDGGVAFGVVPKGIWSKMYPADENNNLYIVNRLFLIETEQKLILVNAGYGNKRSEKYYQFKYIKEQTPISKCIENAGYRVDNVTDVVFTHLHDDHCGGATYYNSEKEKSLPLFDKARFWISKKQWHWALNPNPREAASYFPDNLLPLEESERLHLLTPDEQPFENEDIMLRHYDGHTSGQMIPFMKYQGKTIVYASDFIPSSVHIPLPYIASVDINPLASLAEKEEFLTEAAANKYILVFEHDAIAEACTVKHTEKGFIADEIKLLSQFLEG